jgi:hypothetical protein
MLMLKKTHSAVTTSVIALLFGELYEGEEVDKLQVFTSQAVQRVVAAT